MNVLALNCGSSTLKFDLLEIDPEAAALVPGRRLAGGLVERIGGRATVQFAAEAGGALREAVSLPGHGEAVARVLERLQGVGLRGREGIDAVGHRVVHGGERFVEPTIIDDQVVAVLEALAGLAPLHGAPALSAIRAARTALGPDVPMVATFDTAFHSTMPEQAWRYPIPLELAEKHGIRRYGFHGLAHRYMAERYAEITATPLGQVNLVTLQLGNGCSATAIRGGRSVDTSMGLTPLEGLMMGTRSGDVDPSLAGHLARREGLNSEEAEGWLNTRSGLLGVSGRSRDMREILKAEAAGDASAALAVEMFCYRVRKYVGAYLAVLGGADAIVFGGGIGENAPTVRARVCAGLEWCGLTLDPARNGEAIGSETRISAEGSALHAYVLPVAEAPLIARDTVRCLNGQM
jgi:acetate kinase